MAISSVRNLEEIRWVLREHLPDLRARYGVRSLALFGSYVRGEQEAESDLDILVEYETPRTSSSLLNWRIT